MNIRKALYVCLALGIFIAVLFASQQSSVTADDNPDVFITSPKGEIQAVAELHDLMEDMQRNHKLIQTALLKKDFHQVISPARMCAELANLAALHGKPDQFKTYANDLKTAWLDVAAQAKAEDFEKARTAFSTANDVCASCHNTYRVKDEHATEGAGATEGGEAH